MASHFFVRVGNNIKKYRKEAGITLKELGEKNRRHRSDRPKV